MTTSSQAATKRSPLAIPGAGVATGTVVLAAFHSINMAPTGSTEHDGLIQSDLDAAADEDDQHLKETARQ